MKCWINIAKASAYACMTRQGKGTHSSDLEHKRLDHYPKFSGPPRCDQTLSISSVTESPDKSGSDHTMFMSISLEIFNKIMF